MRTNWIALYSLALPVFAQVKVTQSSGRISVEVDGKPFTALFIGPEIAKPYLFPLRAVSGTSVTRAFPLEESPGDSKDHPHHRGLTFGHADLNGINYWANEGFNPGAKGKIVLDKVERIDTRDGSLILKPGEELRFRYRVVIHPGDASSAGLARLYADCAK